MPSKRATSVHGVVPALTDAVDAIVVELEVPNEFSAQALDEAASAAEQLPRTDHTATPFVTLDPPGSRDLDQAVWIERSGRGYTVWYAIADVGAFVAPGRAMDVEAHLRGETVYLPDRRIPLYPPALSEGAASLLPDEVRPAVVWRLDGLVGTLPPADPRGIARLRRTAQALGIDWPQPMDYPDFIRTLHPATPAHAAMLDACASLLRGAGYVAFDGAVPEQPLHSAVAAAYAHATAPLRRLGDRYVSEICLALCADQPVPRWVMDVLHDVPPHLTERVGDSFAGVVVDVDDKDPLRGVVVLSDPAVQSAVRGEKPLPLGHSVTVRLTEADVADRRVAFEVAAEG
jgi:exoribonuclease R